jgi:hypothetical protein
MAQDFWFGIKPGDMGFDRGGGIVGWIIRHGTGSAYAHSFVYHRVISVSIDGTQTWETVEAYPSIRKSKDGVQKRVRTASPSKVVRVWRSSGEQEAILAHSESMVGTGYGWGEIFRIAVRMVGIKFPGWDSPKRVICSNHCLQSALAARSSLRGFFRYKPYEIWPGELAVCLDAIMWAQDRVREHKRRK